MMNDYIYEGRQKKKMKHIFSSVSYSYSHITYNVGLAAPLGASLSCEHLVVLQSPKSIQLGSAYFWTVHLLLLSDTIVVD